MCEYVFFKTLPCAKPLASMMQMKTEQTRMTSDVKVISVELKQTKASHILP